MDNGSNRRIAFAGDLMTDRQLDALHLADFGGTFIGESGNRGDAVMASYEFIPEVREEEERITRNDRLRWFVSVEELEERWQDCEVVPDVVEDGFPEDTLQAVDPLVGPRFIALQGSVDEALEQLFRKSPKYILDAYEASERTGRLDILNKVPSVVAKLVAEGILSVQTFQQTPARPGFSCYRILRGLAADERRVIGPEGGIARQILGLLGDVR